MTLQNQFLKNISDVFFLMKCAVLEKITIPFLFPSFKKKPTVNMGINIICYKAVLFYVH